MNITLDDMLQELESRKLEAADLRERCAAAEAWSAAVAAQNQVLRCTMKLLDHKFDELADKVADERLAQLDELERRVTSKNETGSTEEKEISRAGAAPAWEL